jgi:hypothetical protein
MSWRESGDVGKRWHRLAVVVGFALFSIVRWPEPFGVDQALFGLFGQMLPEGAVPYRDLWDSKPPAILLLYPLAMALFGKSVEAIWWFESLWLAATLWIAFTIGRSVWDPRTGCYFSTLLLLGLWSPGWGGYPARAQAELFLVLPLLLSLRALIAKDRALAAGLWLGAASLFKLPILAFVVIWCLVGWRSGSEPWLRRALECLAGVALIWGLTFALFSLWGGASEMFDALFGYSPIYARVLGEGLSWIDLTITALGRLATAVPMLSILALAGIAASFKERNSITWLLASWWLLALAVVVFQRQLAEYHFLIVVPPLALAAARALRAVHDEWPRALGAIVLVLAAAAGGYSALRAARVYAPNLAVLTGRIDRPTYLRALQRDNAGPANEAALSRLIQEATKPGERVLVWGLAPGVYFHSDRRPATRFPFHHLLLTEVPLSRAWPGLEARREQFMTQLHAAPPALILVATRDTSYFMPEDSYAQMVRFEPFGKFVRERYAEPDRRGSWLVFQRK